MNVSSRVQERLRELGMDSGPAVAEVGKPLPAVRTGCLIYVSGRTSQLKGKLGRELTIDDGVQAAREAIARAIAAARFVVPSLDDVVRIVRLTGYVNAADDFTDSPAVIDGASGLLIDLFGDSAGAHARTAIGVAQLPQGAAVEVELVIEVAGP